MSEKIVSDPKQDKTLKPKKPVRADEPLPAKEAGPEKEKAPKTPYINKYGFLHVDKDLAKHLGVEFGKDKVDVPVRIEQVPSGFVVKVIKPST
jgi:hypothetical protein